MVSMLLPVEYVMNNMLEKLKTGFPFVGLLRETYKKLLSASQQHGRAELSAGYCVSNTATRVRLLLQAACFDTYAGSWRLEERGLTSQSPSSLRSY